ncbi:UNVERIFIED_CONTAM: hypothetical protein PYX00_000475 [Menopon gallinae]|uniref:Ribosomal protein L14 n=1 Tax=Menopon gallinae TaxID=328185 RepID=A0AAW2I9X9_9NEOP
MGKTPWFRQVSYVVIILLSHLGKRLQQTIKTWSSSIIFCCPENMNWSTIEHRRKICLRSWLKLAPTRTIRGILTRGVFTLRQNEEMMLLVDVNYGIKHSYNRNVVAVIVVEAAPQILHHCRIKIAD